MKDQIYWLRSGSTNISGKLYNHWTEINCERNYSCPNHILSWKARIIWQEITVQYCAWTEFSNLIWL